MGQFKFDPTKAGLIGIERECFINSRWRGKGIVPQAPEILALLESRGIPSTITCGNFWSGTPEYVTTYSPARTGEFGYELSACQIESRIGPCSISQIGKELRITARRLALLLDHFELEPLYNEVGPEDMPLDVYPDPTGRYQRLSKGLPRTVLSAACRVIGTHVHVGMPDHDTALRTYNRVVRHCRELCRMGDGSNGLRLTLYREVAPEPEPQTYTSWSDYFAVATARGFAWDPRKCWTWIRISVHGTLEFRMFGATDSTEQIDDWSRHCYGLCAEAHAFD